MDFFEALWDDPFLWNMFWCVVAAKVFRLLLDPQMFPDARRFAPSARSAAMASLVLNGSILTVVYRGEYHEYPLMLLLAIAFVVCSDAIHRQELSRQAAQFNQLVQELKKHNIECELPQEPLKEDAGCTPVQIVLGIVVGVIVTLIRYAFWGIGA